MADTDKQWYEYEPDVGMYNPTPGYIQTPEARSKEVFGLERVHPTVAVRHVNARYMKTDDPGDLLYDREGEGFFQPICTCKWDGPIVQSYRIATREARDHLWEHLENKT